MMFLARLATDVDFGAGFLTQYVLYIYIYSTNNIESITRPLDIVWMLPVLLVCD